VSRKASHILITHWANYNIASIAWQAYIDPLDILKDRSPFLLGRSHILDRASKELDAQCLIACIRRYVYLIVVINRF
jgi:hypothetical protein